MATILLHVSTTHIFVILDHAISNKLRHQYTVLLYYRNVLQRIGCVRVDPGSIHSGYFNELCSMLDDSDIIRTIYTYSNKMAYDVTVPQTED